MTLFRKRYRIESARKPGWDYTLPGWYFVTICTQGRKPYFGRVENATVELSSIGEYADACWKEVPQHHQHIDIDDFVVMPNHMHGIIWIIHNGVDAAGLPDHVGARHALPLQELQKPRRPPSGPTTAAFGHPPPRALSAIVGSFKSAAARAVNAGRGPGASIWQRNYYEHIIRDERALRRIRRYIETNPVRWAAL